MQYYTLDDTFVASLGGGLVMVTGKADWSNDDWGQAEELELSGGDSLTDRILKTLAATLVLALPLIYLWATYHLPALR